MFPAGNCHSKQEKLNQYVHGRELPFQKTKAKKERKKPQTFGGRQQSSSQPWVTQCSPPLCASNCYIFLSHCFAVQSAGTNEHVVQLRVDRFKLVPTFLGENPGNEVALIDVVMPWAFGGTRSLTHLRTHSILLKSNYTLYSYLPLSITFVQSAFYAYFLAYSRGYQ